jgi:spore coat protein H
MRFNQGFVRKLALFGALPTILCILGVIHVAASDATADDLFSSTNLLRIEITISKRGLSALQNFQREPRVRVPARVTEGGKVFTNVLVQLKGRGTFQSIDRRPSLTLRFTDEGEAFHGLRKFSLNNTMQDPTCLQEKLARELFLAAGVPAARADNAVVRLNGRELGLYVLTEGYDKKFLKRHFKDPNGTFYDGGLFTDVDRRLEVVSGPEGDYTALRALAAAAREPDPELRYAALESALDMDRFLSLIAMETILCHFDGYAMRRTNYRAYHDRSTGKLVLLPQGMDRVLGNFRRHLDLPLFPPMPGLAARALLGTDEGRRRYIQRVGTLYTNLFQPGALCRRVRQMHLKVAPALKDPGQRWPTDPLNLNWVVTTGNARADLDDLCERIKIRAAYLKEQLANVDLRPAPVPKFYADGTVELPPWTVRAPYLTPAATHNDEIPGRHHVITPGPYTAIGCRISLPGGSYRLSARLKAGESEVPRVMLRHFGSAFTPEWPASSPSEDGRLTFDFDIRNAPAPEQVDLLCELRGKGEIWIDSLRLQTR